MEPTTTAPQTAPGASAPAPGQPRRPNWWESLIPRFDLGSMIPLAIVGVLGFFFLRSEMGQNFLRGIINMLPEGWQNNINAMINNAFPGFAPEAANAIAEGMSAEDARGRMTGMGIPAETAQAIAPDDAGWRDFVGQVRAAEGDIMNPVSDKVIYQLMTNRPQLVQSLLRSLPAGGQASEGAQRYVTQARDALRAIVSDPTRYNVLMSSQHRANTLATLEIAVQQFIPFREGALSQFLTTMEPEALRGFLNAMLSPDAGALEGALFNLVKTADPAALATLFQSVNTANADPLVQQIVQLGSSPRNLTALRNLANAVDETTLRQAFTVIQSGDTARIGSLLTENEALRNALVTFAGEVDPNAIPNHWRPAFALLRGGEATVTSAAALASSVDVPAWQQRVFGEGQQNLTTPQLAANVVGTMLDSNMRNQLTQNHGLHHLGTLINAYERTAPAEQREGLEFLGVRGPSRDGVVRYNNLYSLQIFFNEIGTNPDNRANGQRTHTVMTGMTRFLMGDRTALGDLTAEDVSGFFQSRGNRVAFGNLLHNIKIDTLPAQHQAIIRELRQHWGNGEQGIAEMLADPDSVNFMLQVLSGERRVGGGLPVVPGMGAGATIALNFLGREAAWSGWDFGLSGLTGKMRENRETIDDMMRDLRTAGVSLDTSAAPAPRTNDAERRRQ